MEVFVPETSTPVNFTHSERTELCGTVATDSSVIPDLHGRTIRAKRPLSSILENFRVISGVTSREIHQIGFEVSSAGLPLGKIFTICEYQ